MTSFVEILPEEYDADAFKDFDASTADFTIGNARALMWFSQLAYEAHRKDTIKAVRTKWDFTSATPFTRSKTDLKNSFETCGLIGERDDAVILAFAGTDPGVWQNLVTDFTPVPQEGSDIHNGFLVATNRMLPWRSRFASGLENLSSLPDTAWAPLSPRWRLSKLQLLRYNPVRCMGSACRASAVRNFRRVIMRIWAALPTDWSTATTWSRACRRRDCWADFTTSAACCSVPPARNSTERVHFQR
jgi:hypothetical protein